MTIRELHENATEAQRVALGKVFERTEQQELDWPAFVATASFGGFGTDRYIMIPFCGMLLGIEPDGYTHS